MKNFLRFAVLLLGMNLILFRDWVFKNKVPIAFDYGVANYQPWKIDYQEEFSENPKAIGHDDIKIFYPQRKFIVEALKNNIIPFWNPYEFAGNTSLSNSQTATFYPLFVIFLFLPQKIAWTLISFSSAIIVGIGTYLFLEGMLRKKSAVIYGAMVFAFSSVMITRMEDGLVAGQSLIWLPWVLYGLGKYLVDKKQSGYMVSLTALIFSVLAGWFQFTFYVYVLSFLYSLFFYFWVGKVKLGSFLLYLLIFPLSLLLTAFHWFPALEALSYSPRGILNTPVDVTKHLMPVGHLVTLLVPDFFGHIAANNYYGTSEFKEGVLFVGLIPFLLVLLAIYRERKNPIISFFTLIILIAIVMGTNNPISRLISSVNLPVISTFLPNRIFSLAVFSLSVISAFGFQELISNKNNDFKVLVLVATGLYLFGYLIVAGIYVYEKLFATGIGFSFFEKGMERYIIVSFKESLLPFTFLIILLLSYLIFRTARNIIAVVIFFLTMVGLFYSGNRYLYFSKRENEFPQNPIFSFLQEKTQANKSRFITLSYSRIPANVPVYYRLFFPEGIDAMYPIWYGEFSRFFEGKEVSSDDLMRIEVSYAEELERRGWTDPKVLNLLSHLGIQYLVVPKEAFHILPPAPAFTKVFSYKWHTVYEYNYAFPKAYFVNQSNKIENKDVALQRIFHPMFFADPEVVLAKDNQRIQMKHQDNPTDDISNFDLVKKQNSRELAINNPYLVFQNALKKIQQNPVQIIEYQENRMSFAVDASRDGWLVINDSYFPGWQAYLDDQPTAVFRANHAFRAVAVPQGKHQVSLNYSPRTFSLGLSVTKITLLALIIITTGYKWRLFKTRL